MKLRVARHTKALKPLIGFYTGIIGLEVTGRFEKHTNYDGVFIGDKNAGWHLEFTTSADSPSHHPDEDDLLVFYAASVEEYNAIKQRAADNNIKEVPPKNPYWNDNGFTLVDPDGFRVVVALDGV